MPFKSGRLAEVLLNQFDVSAFMFSADWTAFVDTAEVSTFKSSWRSFISGEAFSQLATYGYFDPTNTAERLMIQVLPTTTTGIVSFAPAGATAIGDQVRLISINTADYKEGAKTTSAAAFQWRVNATAPVGFGVSLHPLASEAPGTITGTGDGIMTAGVAGTGLIAHLHVTAYSSGTQNFKLQDATTIGGAYTDIAGGAFTAMTAVGAQRLVVTGTVRQFVRAVATIAGAACTYSIAVARYPT